MVVYRIARSRYIKGLTGAGARLHGGRWNHKGTSIVYTSESRALATVETLVHVPLGLLPLDLMIASIWVPDAIEATVVEPAQLPANWREFPSPVELADLGTRWVESSAALLLRVPSAVVPHEHNFLMNPAHPDMQSVELVDVQEYDLDARLVQR